jgi:hypothetical protein
MCYNVLWEHLTKFETNLMNIKYPKAFLKQCNQFFYHFKDFFNYFKLFENDILNIFL